MTTGWTGEGPAAVFVAVDHHSAECVGFHAGRHGTRFEALEPLRQGVREHFGGCWSARKRRAVQTASAASTCSILRSKVAQRIPLGFPM